MSQAKITLIGIENYLNPERSVFDKMNLPDGIDKETLIGAILLRCQEFELLYSDPDFLIDAVNIWSRKNYWTFDKWVKLINKDYDPLYNKDYYEEITDTHSGDYSKEGSGSSSGNTSENSDFTQTIDTGETVTHSEKAYNNSEYVGTTQDVSNQDGTVRNAGTNSGSYGNTNSNDESGNDSYENKHNYHGYGNIGITSAQELFLKETDVAKWNMYEHIADLFATEFCIMVY